MDLIEILTLFRFSQTWLGLVIQSRKRNNLGKTTNDFGYFNKTWSEYQRGFGDLDSDYWIGLDILHLATSQSEWILRVIIVHCFRRGSKIVLNIICKFIIQFNNCNIVIFQVSLQDWDSNEYVAYYSSMKVANETDNYKLTLTGYDDVRSTLADSFTLGGHATAEFTTFDKDNDNLGSGNCATTYSGGISFVAFLTVLYQKTFE